MRAIAGISVTTTTGEIAKAGALHIFLQDVRLNTAPAA
jgi:hypothetical protein